MVIYSGIITTKTFDINKNIFQWLLLYVCVCVCVYGFLKILCFCLSANVIFMSEKQNCACFLQLEKRFKSTLIF